MTAVWWKCLEPTCTHMGSGDAGAARHGRSPFWHATTTTASPALFARWQAEAEAKAAGR